MRPHYLLVCSALFLFTTGTCVDRNIFSQKIAEPPPAWIARQIDKDLKSFKEKGLYKEDLDNAVKYFQNDLTLLCKVVNHKVLFYNYAKKCPTLPEKKDHARLKAVQYLLNFLVNYSDLPNVEFILSLEDGVTHLTSVPVMAFAKNKYINSLVAFPDFEALRGYNHLIQVITEARNDYPFYKKIPKVFWRGATTGGNYTLSNWKEYPRSKLVIFSKEHPDIVDAKFVNVAPSIYKPFLQKELIHNHLLSKKISIHDHLAFKYLIDIDGNSCTYSRLFWILLSNSLCFKQDSDNEQWYYSALEPYVHYIPFKKDLSDLIEKINWAENHPEEVKIIIDNANTFVHTRLMQEDVFQYVYELLKAYAKLQRFEPKL